MEPIRLASSVIESVRYFPPQRCLELAFRNGRHYHYHGVPAMVFAELLAARSKGIYFNKRIKARYRAQRVDELDFDDGAGWPGPGGAGVPAQ